jgi:hypothetical protein
MFSGTRKKLKTIIVTVAKTNNCSEKMGTVPTQQIICGKTLGKMGLAERIKEPDTCGLSPFFLLMAFCNGHIVRTGY